MAICLLLLAVNSLNNCQAVFCERKLVLQCSHVSLQPLDLTLLHVDLSLQAGLHLGELLQSIL